MFDFLRGVEILAGIFYLVFGVDGFLKKLPMPEPSVEAKNFLQSIENSKFILPTVKFVEIMVGLSFILAWQGPLAWCLLSPIVFVILGYHFFINKKEKLMPLVVFVLHLLLFYKYFSVLRGLITI